MPDFPDRLVTDPARPPQLIIFFGYVGRSSTADTMRIYLDAALSTYVDVPNAAIAYRLQLTRDESLLEGSYVWAQADARLSFGPARATVPWGFGASSPYSPYIRPASPCLPQQPYVPGIPPIHACHPCGQPCGDLYVTRPSPWGFNTPTFGVGPFF
jgi:hypothetical protein